MREPAGGLARPKLLTRLVATLRAWASQSQASVTVAQAPLDVRFGVDRILQPDAMVFLRRLGREQVTPIDQIPEICVEVLSSNRAYDRVTKRFLYAEAGVAEYWIVDPAGYVERRSGPGLARHERITDVLRSTLLPGFELDVAALLREP